MVATSLIIGFLLMTSCPLFSFGFDLKPTTVPRATQNRDGSDGPTSDDGVRWSRRSILRNPAVLMLGIVPWTLLPDSSVAAGPVTEKETDSLGVLARRALRPKPPKLLRRKLSQDFAVLLMRSSYNALDQLDCVAMVGSRCM